MPTTSTLTPEEVRSIEQEQRARDVRRYEMARAALSPWYEAIAETLTDRQAWCIERLVVESLRKSDYFATEALAVTVTIELNRDARKHSPNRTAWVTIEVDPKNRSWGNTHTFALIGKRGRVVSGHMSTFDFGSDSFKKLGWRK